MRARKGEQTNAGESETNSISSQFGIADANQTAARELILWSSY